MENEETTTPQESSDNKWVLISIAVAVVLVLGGGFYFLNQGKTVTGPASPTPTVAAEVSPTSIDVASPSETIVQEQRVSLTDSGFEPAKITIKSGTKVTWTNSSGKEATVNSDPHPTHTNYPPLNLGRFNDGDSLSFTFDKPGTYGYHDHLDPSKKGTVVVQ